MKVTAIHIYGFGQFQNFKLVLNEKENLHWFIGKNEAGKTTIMTFITSILFGFPTKKEKDQRYEPKKSDVYGGALTIETDHKTVVIERVKARKAKGKVNVYFNNGTVKGEEWLQLFLKGIDRTAFQGIFCFGLDGLQHINQLSGNELSRYLYESGMTGAKTISSLEKKLEEESQHLFKPRGKKPQLNQTLKSLQEREKSLRKWEQDFERYEPLLQEDETLESEINQYQNEKQKLLSSYDELQRKQSMVSLIEKKEKIRQTLKRLKPVSYMKEGDFRQFERRNDRMKDLEVQQETMYSRLELLDREINQFSIQPKFRQVEEELNVLHEQIPTYEQHVIQWNREQDEIKTAKEEQEAVEERIGVSGDEQWVKNADISIGAEQQLKDIDEQWQLIKNEREMREEQRATVQEYINDLNEEKEQLTKNILTDEKRQEAVLKAEEPVHHGLFSGRTWSLFLCFIFSGLLFTIGGGVIQSGNVFFGLFLLFFGIGIMYAYGKMSKMRSQKVDSDDMMDKRVTLLEQDRFARAKIEEINGRLEREEKGLLKLKDTLEKAQEQEKTLLEQLEKWQLYYSFPTEWGIHHTVKGFEEMKSWKAHDRNITRAKNEMERLSQHLRSFEASLQHLSETLQIPLDRPYRDWLINLKKMMEKETEKEMKRIRLLDEKERLKTELLRIEEENRRLRQKNNDTLAEVGAEGEEEYRHFVKLKKEFDRLSERTHWIDDQLKPLLHHGESLEDVETTILLEKSNYDEQQSERKDQIQEIEGLIQQLQERRAEIRQDIRRLEEGGDYDTYLQHVEQSKQKLKEEAKEWAIQKTALHLLQQAKSIHEKERQPGVIQKASEYFSTLTGGRYMHVFSPLNEQHFIVENRHGVRFSPDELSRGTAEQLYLSFRFALVDLFEKEKSIPIIMDDPFVNFDKERRQTTFDILKELSDHRQILYFSCHETDEMYNVGESLHLHTKHSLNSVQ